MRVTQRIVLIGVMWLGCGAVYGQTILDKSASIDFESRLLVTRAGTQVTLSDFIAQLERTVPKDSHVELVTSPTRIEGILENILTAEAFYPLAQQAGFLDGSVEQARLYNAMVREVRTIYRDLYLDSIELDNYTQQARELYLVNPSQFVSSSTLDIEQILVTVNADRTETEAMKRIVEVYERLISGQPFVEVAREYSDDPTFDDNQGFLEKVNPTQLVRPVAMMLADLEVGVFSDPIRSRFGWHVFRITNKNEPEPMTWEEARPVAEAMARERHLAEAWERILRDLNNNPMVFEEGAVEAILDHYGLPGFNIKELSTPTDTDSND